MKLRALLLKNGLDNQGFATLTGLSYATINRVASGNYDMEGPNMKKVADALAVSISDIDEFAATICRVQSGEKGKVKRGNRPQQSATA